VRGTFPPAPGRGTCSDATNASQTLISGKLNEVMDLFVAKIDATAGRRNQRRIETEPSSRLGWPSLVYGVLDAQQDQLAGRATSAGSGFV